MDLNDSYIFQSPSNPDHTVLALTVNPPAGLLSPSTFNPNVAYDFEIDRNANSAPDLTIRVRFSGVNRRTGKQTVIVRYLFGKNDVFAAVGQTGEDIPLRRGDVLRADTFDDPFFFDFLGFQDGFKKKRFPTGSCWTTSDQYRVDSQWPQRRIQPITTRHGPDPVWEGRRGQDYGAVR